MRPLLTVVAAGMVALVATTLLHRPLPPVPSAWLSAEHGAPDADTPDADTPDADAPAGVAPRRSVVSGHAGGARPTPAPPDTPVTATVEQRTYAVEGQTEAEILASLRAAGPHLDGGVFFGLTVAENEYRFRYRSSPGRCETVDARVAVQVSVTLPAWTAPTGAPSALRTQWERFDQALQAHEHGHRDLAIAGAHRLLDAIQGVQAPTCDEAADRAARLAERVQIETEARHRQYDEDTGHGATQGASWP